MNIDWNLALTIAIGVTLGGGLFCFLRALIAEPDTLQALLVLAVLAGIVWGGYYVFTSDAQWAKDLKWVMLVIVALPATIGVGLFIIWLVERRPYFYVTEKRKEPEQH